MKSLMTNFASIGAIALAAGLAAQTAPSHTTRQPDLTVTSPAFADGGILPNKYTTVVAPIKAVSPPLAWTHAPAGTVTFVLITADMDSWPSKRTESVVHWMMFNIPVTTTELPEGLPAQAQLPDGSIQAVASHDFVGWSPPHKGPEGPYHHYAFQIYALDTKLALGPDASLAAVQAGMQGHILNKGLVIARFHTP